MKELKQSRNLVTTKFKIGAKKLFYTVSKFGNSEEVAIPFEEINSDVVSHKQSINILLYISLCIYGVCLIMIYDMIQGGKSEMQIMIIFSIIATLLIGYYYYRRQEFWKIMLSNNKSLFIEKKTPSEIQVSSFIENLMKSRNSYLKENYAIIDENVDYISQLETIKWLKRTEAISDNEYNELYKELKATVKPKKKQIGFGNKPSGQD